jgi:hypothetical protein
MCRFQACLLNTSLKNSKICELYPQLAALADGKLSSLTFGDLDGKELQFPMGSSLKPFKRALCLQANLAIREAREQIQNYQTGWRTIDLTDFWSEGGSYVEKVCAWLAENPSSYGDEFFELALQEQLVVQEESFEA